MRLPLLAEDLPLLEEVAKVRNSVVDGTSNLRILAPDNLQQSLVRMSSPEMQPYERPARWITCVGACCGYLGYIGGGTAAALTLGNYWKQELETVQSIL